MFKVLWGKKQGRGKGNGKLLNPTADLKLGTAELEVGLIDQAGPGGHHSVVAHLVKMSLS